jgi:hypothetical protein
MAATAATTAIEARDVTRLESLVQAVWYGSIFLFFIYYTDVYFRIT